MVDFEKNFFIIESTNLDSVKTKLYGYAICNYNIILDSYNKKLKVDGTGAYIYVNVNSDEIQIFQDINGSFGLYVFESENYFAISNSFLMLVNQVKEKFNLTLNQEYTKSFISAEYTSYLYCETLINEIFALPRDYMISINKNLQEITFNRINYEENTVDLNSKEGMEILDEWVNKWSKILRNIIKFNQNISCDLSGGFDSRNVLALLIASDINLNEININSIPALEEDYSISSKIAKDLNFTLNKQLNVDYETISNINTLFEPSFLTKLGFSKGFHPIFNVPKDKIFVVTGYCGESIRGFPTNANLKNDILYRELQASNYFSDEDNDIKNISKKNYDKLHHDFPNEKDGDLVRRLYKETRYRYNYGKNVVERYLNNYVYLVPLSDPILYKLKISDDKCKDVKLLISIIYDRYCSKLLDFNVEGNRNIDEFTKRYAKSINIKYPHIHKSQIKIPIKGNVTTDVKHLNTKLNPSVVKKYLHDIFTTVSFKNNFLKYFPQKIYENCLLDFERDNIWSFTEVYSIISILKIIDDIEYSNKKHSSNIINWLNHFLDIPEFDTTNIIKIGNINISLPPNFRIKNPYSIKDDKTIINIQIEDNSLDIVEIINNYLNYVKSKNGFPEYTKILINNIVIHKVNNLDSKTTRYWFKINDVVYQIYTYLYDEFTDLNVKYMVNSIIMNNQILINDLIFTLPPGFWITGKNSISNGENHIKITYNDQNTDVNKKYEKMNINGIKICVDYSNKINTYVFMVKNIVYKITTDNSTDEINIKYLINSIKFNLEKI